MKDYSATPGCPWVIGTASSIIPGTDPKPHPVFCDKIPAENSKYCPKHVLFEEDQKQEAKRREGARILRRNLKTLEDEALAASPLAAVNEEYKGKVVAPWLHGYSK